MPDELDHRVELARAAYADRRPRSAAASLAAAEVLPGGSTRSVLDTAPFPLKIDMAHGNRLVDLDGHEYLDLLGDYSAGLLGHSPAAVAAAVQTRSSAAGRTGRPTRWKPTSPGSCASDSRRSSRCGSPTRAPKRT